MNGVGKRITILGATGSIGTATARVVTELRAGGAEIEVEALAAGSNLPKLAALVRELRPRFVAVADPSLLQAAREALPGIAVGAGPAAVVEAAARDAGWVMSAIVGAAGLDPTLAAVRRGATIALANKECLVCAGPLMTAEAARSGARLVPVDSEHSAIFQVLQQRERVEKLTLTASGGPFLHTPLDVMARATPEEACAHPKWRMGAKISVDSATLMNKGLELIEASYLFDFKQDKIDVLIHPESVVHSLVHYVDGSVLAQLGAPDMRTPIAYALAWPDRAPVSVERLDLARVGTLSFFAPDVARFPALEACRQALMHGHGATAALNAANEVAVAAFLARRIGLLSIAAVVEETLQALFAGVGYATVNSPTSFDEVRAVDQAARRAAIESIDKRLAR